MHEFLAKLIGRKVDVVCCGTITLSGELIRVEDGVLHLKDDQQQLCYVAIDKIAVIWESRDGEKHAGFGSPAPNNR